jgi:hypothetical protein
VGSPDRGDQGPSPTLSSGQLYLSWSPTNSCLAAPTLLRCARAGYLTEWVATGQEALFRLSTAAEGGSGGAAPVDVVLKEHGGTSNAVRFLKRLRDEHSRVPVIGKCVT